MATLPEVIRDVREGTGMTQRQVAEELDWHPSKVLRMENGQVGITVSDLRALLQLYGVTDKERIEQLSMRARVEKPTTIRVVTAQVEVRDGRDAQLLVGILEREMSGYGGRPKVTITDTRR